MQHPDDGLLHEWLDGELAARDAEALAAHVRECPACTARVREERGAMLLSDNLLAELDEAETPLMPDVASARPLRHGAPVVLLPSGAIPGAGRRRLIRTMSVAATLVITAGAGWLAFHAGTPEARTANQILSDAPASAVPVSPAPSRATADSLAAVAREPDPAAGAPASDQTSTPARHAAEPRSAEPSATGRVAEFNAPTLAPVAPKPGGGAARRESESVGLSGAAPENVAELQTRAAARPPLTLEQDAQISTRIGLDEARDQLGGNVHVIEGMRPEMIGLVPGRLVAGADSTRPVVRVVYVDDAGRSVFLDQQRLSAGFASRPVLSGPPDGWRAGDVQLRLHGALPEDSLRGLARRVR